MNVFIKPELCAKLERLGVHAFESFDVGPGESNGNQWSEGFVIRPRKLTIFDLLYPENCVKVWGKDWNVPDAYGDNETSLLLWHWQNVEDWQTYVERAVDERLKIVNL